MVLSPAWSGLTTEARPALRCWRSVARCFFTGNDGVHGYQLWAANTTSAGAVMLSNVSGVSGMGLGWPAWLTNFNGTLYFEGNDSTNGDQLWKSDGTVNGTQRVTSLIHGGFSLSPRGLTVSNGRQ
jgi:ELWxxDGT repeat protein